MSKGKKKIAIWSAVFAVALISFDQLTKWLSVIYLKNQPAFVLIENVLELDYLENRGVAFGMFQNQRWPILIFGMVIMALMIWLMIKLPEGVKYNILHFLFVGVIAGGIGNMIDRFFYGYVVDFISFVLIHYPVFNVADCYVVCAVVGLCIMFLFVLKDDELTFISLKQKNKGKDISEESIKNSVDN